MTAVIAALVTGLLTFLGTALPLVAQSKRRRLLKLITEEAVAIKAVKEAENEHALEYLTQALTESAWDYRDLAEPPTPLKAAKQRYFRWAPLTVVVVLAGLLSVYWSSGVRSEELSTTLFAAGLVLIFGSAIANTHLVTDLGGELFRERARRDTRRLESSRVSHPGSQEQVPDQELPER